MLGTRPDPALRKELISRVTQKEQVLNISNILLHNLIFYYQGTKTHQNILDP